MTSKYKTKDSALARGKEAIGKSFQEINQIIINRGGIDGSTNTKGKLGNILQLGWFNVPVNNLAEPDLKDAGIEIKVTGYKKAKPSLGGFQAKERLVCNIINYETENLDNFYESSFWKKNQSILLFVYHYEINKNNCDAIITDVNLLDFNSEEYRNDLNIIKNDWNIITEKIKNGYAHELSERDTRYLGAATKGETAEKSLRSQPFSTIKAKQRAYSLKSQYLTKILREKFKMY